MAQQMIDVVGTSKESFAKAAENAVAEAAKTVRGMKWARVGELEMELDGKKIIQYQTTTKITSTLKNSGVDCAQGRPLTPRKWVELRADGSTRTRLSHGTVTRLDRVDRLLPGEHTVIRSVAHFLCRQDAVSNRTA